MLDDENEIQLQQALRIPPWVWAMLVSVVVQFGGAVWITATMAARIDTLTDRVGRLERQIDSITNITRSPRGYNSPPIAP